MCGRVGGRRVSKGDPARDEGYAIQAADQTMERTMYGTNNEFDGLALATVARAVQICPDRDDVTAPVNMKG